MFNWFKPKQSVDTLSDLKFIWHEIEFIKNTLKQFQNQLDTFEIGLLENKKTYKKQLKDAVEAMKEEEEGSEEEEETKEKFL